MFTRANGSTAAASNVFANPARGGLRRSALMLGTALGCSIAVLAAGTPGQVWAADECGPAVAVGGTASVTCGPSTDYPTGITYVAPPLSNIIVTLDSGVTVENPAGQGVTVSGQTGYYTQRHHRGGRHDHLLEHRHCAQWGLRRRRVLYHQQRHGHRQRRRRAGGQRDRRSQRLQQRHA